MSVAMLLLAQLGPGASAQGLPQPQTQGGVTFITGGVAEDSQQAMRAVSGQYNLRLLFAQLRTGAYFAQVPVEIRDSAGATVLRTVSNGPFLYARLNSGRYTVVASHNGVAQTRSADVPAAGGVDLNFYWE